MKVKDFVTGNEVELTKGVVESCVKKGIPWRSQDTKDVKIPNVLGDEDDLRKKLNAMGRPILDETAKELDIEPAKFSNREKLIEEIMSKNK